MPPKVDRNKFRIRKKTGETIVKLPGEIDGKDFCISHCEDCEIYLYDFFEQVFVDDSKNCKVFIGPTRGSIFMRECQDMKLYSASQQLRISDSTNVTASVYTGSDPALENVKGLKIAPFNFCFPGVAEFFTKAELDPNSDYWSQVFDFTPSKVQGENNWELLNPEEYEGQILKEIEGYDQPLDNPVAISTVYGGTCEKEIIVGSQDPASTQDAEGMMSFNIQTSQQQAAQQMDQADQQEQPQQEQQQEQQDDDFGQFDEQPQQQQQQQQQDFNQYQDFNQQQDFQQEQQQQQQFQQQQDFGQNQFQPQQQQFDSSLDPEELKRKQELQAREQQIFQRVLEIQNNEKDLKEQKRREAQQWLVNWQQERETMRQRTGQFNRESNQQQKESRQQENQGTSSWKKVTNNIALKVSDYPGKNDVDAMKRSILNRRKDEESHFGN